MGKAMYEDQKIPMNEWENTMLRRQKNATEWMGKCTEHELTMYDHPKYVKCTNQMKQFMISKMYQSRQSNLW